MPAWTGAADFDDSSHGLFLVDYKFILQRMAHICKGKVLIFAKPSIG
jgi:hypothetical protein